MSWLWLTWCDLGPLSLSVMTLIDHSSYCVTLTLITCMWLKVRTTWAPGLPFHKVQSWPVSSCKFWQSGLYAKRSKPPSAFERIVLERMARNAMFFDKKASFTSILVRLMKQFCPRVRPCLSIQDVWKLENHVLRDKFVLMTMPKWFFPLNMILL